MQTTLPRTQFADLHFVTPQVAVGGDLNCRDNVRACRACRDPRKGNVWYAADALTWQQRRSGVDAATAAGQHADLACWRDANPLDVQRRIRTARKAELRRR